MSYDDYVKAGGLTLKFVTYQTTPPAPVVDVTSAKVIDAGERT
jgi:hypothetical protein